MQTAPSNIHWREGRVTPLDDPDYFPTQPWGTRAAIKYGIGPSRAKHLTAYDPACGEGHMIGPMREFFKSADGSDKYDYGRGYRVADFLEEPPPHDVDWIITNPPYSKNIILPFTRMALDTAKKGVLLIVKPGFLAAGRRYTELLEDRPPTLILQFCDRLTMLKGKMARKTDNGNDTATIYIACVWDFAFSKPEYGRAWFDWIPPGTRALLERDEDYYPLPPPIYPRKEQYSA